MIRLPPHRLFPSDAEPFEVFVDRLFEFRATARRVDVLDAQKETSAERTRHLEVDQRGQRVAEVEVAVRRRREAENGLLHGCGMLGVTFPLWERVDDPNDVRIGRVRGNF